MVSFISFIDNFQNIVFFFIISYFCLRNYKTEIILLLCLLYFIWSWYICCCFWYKVNLNVIKWFEVEYSSSTKFTNFFFQWIHKVILLCLFACFYFFFISQMRKQKSRMEYMGNWLEHNIFCINVWSVFSVSILRIIFFVELINLAIFFF